MSPQEDLQRSEKRVAETTESISARLEGAKIAQTQIRFTLGTMAVISVMMLIASYNAYLSYDYFWIVDEKCPKSANTQSAVANVISRAMGAVGKYWDGQSPESVKAAPEQATPNQVNANQAAPEQVAIDATKELKNQAYRDWTSSRTGLISLLGIRVSVDDASVLGTAVLFVLSLWLLLVSRRENHTIGYLLRDTDERSPDCEQEPTSTEARGSTESPTRRCAVTESWRIYQTIISNSLFVVFYRLPKVSSLAGQDSLEAILADDDNKNDRRSWLTRVALGFARSFFFWFPVFASAFMFVLDRLSYFRQDPFDLNCEGDGFGAFFLFSTLVFLACWIPLNICCRKSSLYSRATENVLRDYGIKLATYLSPQKQSTKS